MGVYNGVNYCPQRLMKMMHVISVSTPVLFVLALCIYTLKKAHADMGLCIFFFYKWF